MNADIRTLVPGDEPALSEFLARHADSSMFLRSNFRAAGLVDTGAIFSGTYVGAFLGERLAGVAAHCWNGILLVQVPANDVLTSLVQAVVRTSGRAVKGLCGPLSQVTLSRQALSLHGQTALDSQEDLFALPLEALKVPDSLRLGTVRCRPPLPGELDLLTEWAVAYAVEALHATPGPQLLRNSRNEVHAAATAGTAWVLAPEGLSDRPDRLLACSYFNAALPDMVQIGGVFTPKALRGLGHGRAVVAGSLLFARDSGVTRAILFTDRDNHPARRAYQALGFQVVGDYALVLYP